MDSKDLNGSQRRYIETWEGGKMRKMWTIDRLGKARGCVDRLPLRKREARKESRILEAILHEEWDISVGRKGFEWTVQFLRAPMSLVVHPSER